MSRRPRPRDRRRRYVWMPVLALVLAFGVYLHGQYVPPILMYHRIDHRLNDGTALSVAPGQFERQMAFLKRHKRVVPLERIVERIRLGRPPERGAVAITFDDGFESVYTHAWPVLRRYGLPATVYIVTDWVGTPEYMTWEQIREMAAAGIDIGAHTRTHPWLPSMDAGQLEREVAGGRRILQAQVPGSGRHFCYPFGAYDTRSRRAVREAGHASATATNPGRLCSWRDPYALKRLRVSKSADNLFVFWVECTGYYTWMKEHRGKHLWRPKPCAAPTEEGYE